MTAFPPRERVGDAFGGEWSVRPHWGALSYLLDYVCAALELCVLTASRLAYKVDR